MADKLPECDREAARLLALQTKRSPGAQAQDVLLTALLIGALAVFSLLHILLPDREMSETENRTLTPLPTLSWERLEDGRFTADVADYMADQFPGRDFFVNLKSAAELALGKGGNNGVLFGRDQTLIARDDLPNTDNLRDNLAAMAAFARCAADRGIPATAAITGRSADVLDHTLPAYYGSYYSDRLWGVLQAEAEAVNLPLLNLRDPLREAAADGEYVYYRTDHHWTSYGAYLGYRAILESVGETPRPITDFTRETVSTEFYGTTWSTAGASWISPDEMEFFRYAGDTEFTTVIEDNGHSFAGFYDGSYLSVKDKYSAFLSGNHALVTVRQNTATDRPVLLVVKDSFAHAAAPFLACHYDLVIVDLRYYKKSTAALLDAYDVDRVLYLMNVDSLSGSTVLRMLEAGLDKE